MGSRAVGQYNKAADQQKGNAGNQYKGVNNYEDLDESIDSGFSAVHATNSQSSNLPAVHGRNNPGIYIQMFKDPPRQHKLEPLLEGLVTYYSELLRTGEQQIGNVYLKVSVSCLFILLFCCGLMIFYDFSVCTN